MNTCFLSDVDPEPALRSIILESDKNNVEHERFLKRKESEDKILSDLHAELKAELSVKPPKKTDERRCARLRKQIEKQGAFCETVRIAVRDANKIVLRGSDNLSQRVAATLSRVAQDVEAELKAKAEKAIEDYVTCSISLGKGYIAAQNDIEDLINDRSVIDAAELRIEAASKRLIKAANGAG